MDLCQVCASEKKNNEFYSYNGYRSKICKLCYSRQTALANLQKGYYLKKFGITKIQYDEMLLAQNYTCAICDKKHAEVPVKKWARARLGVDHDHETGKVRGLLCSNCNTVLGLVKDKIETLETAIQYLKRNETSTCVQTVGSSAIIGSED